MVDVRGGLKFAFSTYFSPKREIKLEDIKLDGKMFPGIQEQVLENVEKEEDENVRKVIEFIKDVRNKIKEKRKQILGDIDKSVHFLKDNSSEEIPSKIIDLVKEKASIENFGSFLQAIKDDVDGLSNKIHIMSNSHLKRVLEIGKQSFEDLREITKQPSVAVRKAIFQCFELFEVPKNEIKEYKSDDGEILFINDTREFSISYKEDDQIKELQFLEEKDPDKKHAYEVKWVHFNVSRNRWMDVLRKMSAKMTDSVIKFVAPRIGNTLGSLIKKTMDSKSDEILEKACNFDLKLIFHELLRTNLAIESIKFQKFDAELWNDEDKKNKIVEFGKDLIKSSDIVNLIPLGKS